MQFGPVEVLVCAFPHSEVDVPVINSLSEAVNSGAVTLVDLVLMNRDEQGTVHVRDLEDDLPAAWSALTVGTRPPALLSNADLDEASKSVGNNETALVAALEYRWAAQLSEEVRKSGGNSALHTKRPQEPLSFARGSRSDLLRAFARPAGTPGTMPAANPAVSRPHPHGEHVPGQEVPRASPVGVEQLTDQLFRLAELHDTGALTNDEFVAAKARLLM